MSDDNEVYWVTIPVRGKHASNLVLERVAMFLQEDNTDLYMLAVIPASRRRPLIQLEQKSL